MDPSDIPDSHAIPYAPAVPPIRASREEILARPFTLHEAAFLVATPEEWGTYMVVGREPRFFELWIASDGRESRYQIRRRLEALFWDRIRRHVRESEWRAVEVAGGEERSLSRFQIECYPDPFVADSGLLVMEVRSRVTTQGDKEQLRRALSRWLAEREKAGDAPRSKPEWLAIAKRKFPSITPNLFNVVWASLGHPHPLKLDGRPGE